MRATSDICEYVEKFPAATLYFKADWAVTQLLLDGKMFGMIGEDNRGTKLLTIKLKPENGELLREQYSDIVSGYYMNKTHWNSIDLSGCVPDDVIKAMIKESYQLILASLTKKRQKEISDNQV
ncbi:hypothetical protein Hs30E_14130 [Lactococcus hodotermopsidis]|uniref:DNA-binding protein n=1 Tax=Pseudolactococcus hodotermopsidis TaxID=2709157 RepID=A0A6A0BBZ3_9LACT|nr:MmcQ/YjbR family DNA-binding protein [Lactococcus hodotermopsidis]GFH42862.1 hypothetical protein Hs30E_14130 [Lactococcus hodotermopsidis]